MRCGAGPRRLLTRSIVWPTPVLLCPLLFACCCGRRSPAVSWSPPRCSRDFAAVVRPWAVRNTRLQGVVEIVDTMGGLNLRMGNYMSTARGSHVGRRRHARTRELGVRAEPGAPGRVLLTEGQKDKWAQKKAIEYIRASIRST